MRSLEEFNGLNGAVIYREDIGNIIQLAKDENQSEIIYRLSKVLNENPENNVFEISIKQYPPAGLNGSRHAGSYKEALDECGRLNPGYRFENGAVVKVFKPIKKEKPAEAKPKATVLAKEKKIKKILPKVEKKPDPVKPKTTVSSGNKKAGTKAKTAAVLEKNKVSESQANKKNDLDLSYTIHKSGRFFIPKINNRRINGTGFVKKWEAVAEAKEAIKRIMSNPEKWEKFFENDKALKDILSLKKYSRIDFPLASVVYKYFKDSENINSDDEVKVISELHHKMLDIDSPIHYYSLENLSLTDFGVDFVNAVNGRNESLNNQKSNYILFDGLRGVQENISDPEIEEIVQIIKEEMPERKVIVFDNGMPQKLGTSKAGESKFFTVNGEVGKFLQQVEKKPFGSVVITIDGMQGAGKTTMLYQFMESFDSAKNNCLFISGEEDPNSHLAKSKAEKFLSDNHNVLAVGEVKDVRQLYSYIEKFDIIFIDSWQKLQRMVGNIRLDEDLRKKFNGKVFVIIFQQTTTGRTKGGAEVVFDGDIIIKMAKGARFELNYAFFDKNRYTLVPIETIRYNIAAQKCYNPEEKEIENIENHEPIKLSFNVIEN